MKGDLTTEYSRWSQIVSCTKFKNAITNIIASVDNTVIVLQSTVCIIKSNLLKLISVLIPLHRTRKKCPLFHWGIKAYDICNFLSNDSNERKRENNEAWWQDQRPEKRSIWFFLPLAAQSRRPSHPLWASVSQLWNADRMLLSQVLLNLTLKIHNFKMCWLRLT